MGLDREREGLMEKRQKCQEDFCCTATRTVLILCTTTRATVRGVVGRGEGGGEGVFEGGRAGSSKSFGRFDYVCRGVLVAMVVIAA